jgi:hypothetical protein
MTDDDAKKLKDHAMTLVLAEMLFRESTELASSCEISPQLLANALLFTAMKVKVDHLHYCEKTFSAQELEDFIQILRHSYEAYQGLTSPDKGEKVH